MLTLVVDAATGHVTDSGLSNRYPDLAKLGMVTTGLGWAPYPGARQSSEPYQLYTHCGIRWAKFHGTYWKTSHLLSDGQGNPPAGWGNPSQAGILTFTRPTTAVFKSTAAMGTMI